MANTQHITYKHPYEQTGRAATESVYMITPNEVFVRLWKATHDEQANPGKLSQAKIEITKRAIEKGDKVTIHLPHVSIERDQDGVLLVSFIDGRHRFAAHKALNMNIPMLVETNIAGDLSHDQVLKSFVSPLPEQIKKQIEGENTGAHESRDHMRETIRQWVRENEKLLRRQLHAKYGQFVGDKAFAFYAKHGEFPKDHVIEQWQEEAKKHGHSTEPDREAQQAIAREEMRKSYVSLVGEAHADRCVDVALATGRPIHRDTVEAMCSGLSTKEAITREMQEPQRDAPVQVTETAPAQTSASDRLAALQAQHERSHTEQRQPRKWFGREPGSGGGGLGMGSR